MGTKNISFKNTSLDVDMGKYLSRHDIVYLSPATEGYEGLHVGNGDMGAMTWTPPDKIHFQINKCDTWDDAEPGQFGAWEDSGNPDKAERFTALRSCGEISITPGLPVFDWMYLEDFRGRLSLGKAQVDWLAKGPLGLVECQAFVSREPGVLAIHYNDKLSEAVTRRVDLARWGSRVFEHWYAMIRRDSLLGPEGTSVGCDNDEIWLEQPLRDLNFAMACKITGIESVPSIRNSRQVGFDLNPGKDCAFSLFLAVATSEETQNPLKTALDKVRSASMEGMQRVNKRHRQYWSDFWSQSFIDLPDDYLTNLWYMNVYQAGSSSSGNYPPHFISSIWSWNRDVRPWNHYYHWNQQQYTWPLHASGHHDLMLPYAKWRREGLEHAVEDAETVFNRSGAVYFDVANRRGWQGILKGDGGIFDVDITYHISPGLQISLDLWRHYQYTLDSSFLEQYAYPVMRECVRFYVEYLQLGEDGCYHVPKSDPYETEWLHCRDSTSDLSHIRAAFKAFADADAILRRDKQLVARVVDILAKLTDFIYTEIPDDKHSNERTTVISCGIDLETGIPAHGSYQTEDGKKVGGHVVNAQLAPIFPTGIIGLDYKETKEFEIMKNTLSGFDPIFNISAHGHNIVPICMARMGLREELATTLKDWVDDYQLFSQGFFCYFKRDYAEMHKRGLYPHVFHASEHKLNTLTNHVRILGKKTKENIDLPRKPFSHMALEAGAIFETTINEMLLQSYSGNIRVFPAIPSEWNGTFKLHAVGGFVVTAERQDSETLYVAVESKCGERCCIINPWERERVQIRDLTESELVLYSGKNEKITFNTQKDHVYLVERLTVPITRFGHKQITGRKNRNPKKSGCAILGKPRQF